jgi:hypothetical protein
MTNTGRLSTQKRARPKPSFKTGTREFVADEGHKATDRSASLTASKASPCLKIPRRGGAVNEIHQNCFSLGVMRERGE